METPLSRDWRERLIDARQKIEAVHEPIDAALAKQCVDPDFWLLAREHLDEIDAVLRELVSESDRAEIKEERSNGKR